MTRERTKGIVGIFVLITVLFFIFIIFAFYTVSQLKQTSDMSSDWMSSMASAPIGVIPVEGEIRESRRIVEMLLDAEKDSKIKAIIMRIDSPGGAVGPTQEIYEEIVRIDKKKPIYASFGTVAASGGYYIGAATRKIYSNSGTLTGSIGVIMQLMDLSEVFKFVKVKPEIIKAGRYKDIGSPSRGMTEEEKMLLTDLLADTHKKFREDITAVRGDRLKIDINELAQGQIFSGDQALKVGLVDEIGSLWTAGRAIHKELKFKGDFAMRFFKPRRDKVGLADLLSGGDEALSFIKSKMSGSSSPSYLYQPGQ